MRSKFQIRYKDITIYKIIILFIFCSGNNVLAQNNKTSAVQSFPEAKIPGSEVRKITSSIVNQEYELQLSFPSGYSSSNKKYPVLYLMDSQWDFPLVTALYGEQYYDGFIPEMIIVGITWGGINPNPDSLRVRDYTPTNEKTLLQSGGASIFLSFIKNELFPFIETNYKADKNNRILMGCSLGGLFTLYTLFTQPGMFQRYIAASPAFGWDNEVLYQYEKKYFENKLNPSVRLFMCIGGVETSVPGFKKLEKHLNDRHYTSLQIESRILENTGHSGTKGEGFARGLQYVYKRPSLRLSLSVLNKYIGNYKFDNGNTVDVKLEEGVLAAYLNGSKVDVFHAATESDFYSTAGFLNVHFKKDDKGDVSGFQLETYGRSEFVKKIN
jgi:predicted alpha/beta superfamily hydrolase